MLEYTYIILIADAQAAAQYYSEERKTTVFPTAQTDGCDLCGRHLYSNKE